MATFDRTPARIIGQMDLRLSAPGGVARALPVPRMAGSVIGAPSIVLPALTGAPAKIIKAKVRDVVTVYIIDHSGSMYPQTSGDATGIRCAAALSLVGLQRTSGGGMTYVVGWGTTVPDELVFGPLDVIRDRKAIKAALTVPPTLGGNDLPLALRRTLQVAPPQRGKTYIYLVISDGIEAVTQATRDALAALPRGAVHMILVDRGSGCSPAMEADWNNAGFASVVRLKTFNTLEMAHELGDIYATTVGLTLPAPKSPRK
jgi:hypothetical protein